MNITDIMNKKDITKNSLAKTSGIPCATLNDICSGKTRIERCSAKTVFKLAQALNVSMESLVVDSIRKADREQSYEYGLPEYLQKDLDAYKKGLKEKSGLIDCLWGELYGSINMAEISESTISHEHAEYLRNKFLWGKEVENA